MMEKDFVSASEAARWLGVKPATFYTYVSRGLVRRVPSGEPGGRVRKLYLRIDVEKLKAKAEARSGHGPVARAALKWGQPVLNTSLSHVREGELFYRQRPVLELLGQDLEEVAELLWGQAPPVVQLSSEEKAVAREGSTFERLTTVWARLQREDPDRHQAPPAGEVRRATRLLSLSALALGERRVRGAGSSWAATLARGWLPAKDAERATSVVNAALVLLADHELNPSAFAVRVVASTGADLYACLLAGVGALSGPRHGGACDRIHAFLDDVELPSRAGQIVKERAARGESLPGFGHPLYPEGDPRTPPLLKLAAEGPGSARLDAALAWARAMRRRGHGPPTVDFGLVALAEGSRLPRHAATSLFALGRTEGWVAHVLEQRSTPGVIRPRARFVGPDPERSLFGV